LGRGDGPFFLSCPGSKQPACCDPAPILTLHGVVFAILCPGRFCVRDQAGCLPFVTSLANRNATLAKFSTRS
jgi:hypothetical protein